MALLSRRKQSLGQDPRKEILPPYKILQDAISSASSPLRVIFSRAILPRGRKRRVTTRARGNPLSRRSIFATITFSLRPALTTTGQTGTLSDWRLPRQTINSISRSGEKTRASTASRPLAIKGTFEEQKYRASVLRHPRRDLDASIECRRIFQVSAARTTGRTKGARGGGGTRRDEKS